MNAEILEMDREDAEFCAEQAAREGWNPGLHDMDAFYGADPKGWFKAVDASGRTVGGVSAVAYDETFGFIGFFVVVPEHRGGRVGIQLGMRALEHLGGRTIGQDGVFAKVANYETWGFELAYRNVRHEWPGGSLPEAAGVDVSPYRPELLAALAAYEAPMFPCPRESFLANWLSLPESRTAVALAGGAPVGYGMRRRCRTGCKIGPLFADDGRVARALLRDLLADVEPGAPVYLDVPEPNGAGMALAAELGMKPCFGTARMYKNGRPELDVGRIFGVTSFELG
jgi:GNAT superfamily N-acetyltransferase